MWLLFLLILITPSSLLAQTETNTASTSQAEKCSAKEYTSFTLLWDGSLYPWYVSYPAGKLLNGMSERFPCGIRQYASIKATDADISEVITRDKDTFINDLNDYNWFYNYYTYLYKCNQSLLYGLRRALVISPAESLILVLNGGSMVDYTNTSLLNEIYSLIDEKQSQVFFMTFQTCGISSEQENIYYEISSRSFGQFLYVPYYNLYQAISGLDLLLSKPLNSSLRILNEQVYIYGQYTQQFNVTISLPYMLITTNLNWNLNITDPTGSNRKFEKTTSLYSGGSYLVKNPTNGTWTFNVFGYGNISVKIMGFYDLESHGKCSDSDCNPNATCTEFGGYQQCTCKLGFAGDGSYCYDINECDDYYLNYCNYGYCVNTVGSYTCACSYGFTYTDYGCTDIDECSQANDCSPYAVCTNYYGSYSCSCPYGYIGNGTYCEINECQQGIPCGHNKECTKVIGSYSCTDPCSNYTILNDPWRSTFNRFEHYAEVQAYLNYYGYWWYYYYYGYYTNYYSFYYNYYYNFVHCDYNLQGWYRFKGENNVQMFDHPVAENSCGTQYPMTLNGSHPNVGDGIVNRNACPYRDNYDCWWTPTNVSIKACPGGFYVYKLSGTPGCNFAYCTNSNAFCSGTDCSSDEECRNNDGNSKCYCKNSTLANNGVQSSNLNSLLTPTLTCDLYKIKISYSKCLLEQMGLNSSYIHLIDNNCTNFIERNNQSFATLITLPKSGYCGGQLLVNDTYITYINTIYLEKKSDGLIVRDPYAVNFYCAFQKNMETSLSTAISPFASVGNFTVGAMVTYLVKMGLFTNFDFSTQYQEAEVSLDSKSMLYVGLIVEDAEDTNFLLVLRNCYATPTAVSSDPVKYYIIRESCPNVNDPTITVHENGVSNQGRFSVQVFKFIGNFPQIYLHCQVTLCDKTLGTCNPWCAGMRAANTNYDTKSQILSRGPIKQQTSTDKPVYETNVPSPAKAVAAAMEALISALLLFLII